MSTHTDSLESALDVPKETATIAFGDEVHTLHAGDTYIVAADGVHHVTSGPDFRAVHITPRAIRFNFKEYRSGRCKRE